MISKRTPLGGISLAVQQAEEKLLRHEALVAGPIVGLFQWSFCDARREQFVDLFSERESRLSRAKLRTNIARQLGLKYTQLSAEKVLGL
jgi:hypothetical protein